MPNRRDVLATVAHACTGLVATNSLLGGQPVNASESTDQRFLLVGLCGSENPTRANFPFVWAVALRAAGNDVRIELAGDATVLMRSAVSDSATPVGWPPFREALAKVIEHKIPIFV
jgi:hypothetical protein